jgi:predicted dehydrogenase
MARVGLVGLGYWGPNLVRNLYELPDAEVAYVCDLREDALAKVARRYPSVTPTTRYADLLEDESVDAIVIATPVSSHHPLASAALGAGKHVFVEKPLAPSSADAEKLAALSEEVGRVLMCGHTFVYSPPVQAVKRLIDSGELGELYFISSSRVNLGPYRSDVSVLWDLAPHDLSILLYWLERSPVSVSAVGRDVISPGIQDVAFVDLVYEDGLLAHLELSWLAPSKLRRTTIVGSRKMIVYDDTSTEPVRVFDSGAIVPNPETFGQYRLTYRTGDIVSPHVEAAEPLYLELEDFCAAILQGTEPRSSAQIGLEVVHVIEAVHASLARGGDRVAVDQGISAIA